MKLYAMPAFVGALAVSIFFAAFGAQAADAVPGVKVTTVTKTATTATGQPLVFPQSNAEVVVSIFDLQAGAKLPVHLHPYPRYGYVLAGTLRVTNQVTGQVNTYKTGEFLIDAQNQWHSAEVVGDVPLKLLVIDNVEGDKSNTVLKK